MKVLWAAPLPVYLLLVTVWVQGRAGSSYPCLTLPSACVADLPSTVLPPLWGGMCFSTASGTAWGQALPTHAQNISFVEWYGLYHELLAMLGALWSRSPRISSVRDKGAHPVSMLVTASLFKKPGQGFNFNSLFNYNLALTLPNVKEKK